MHSKKTIKIGIVKQSHLTSFLTRLLLLKGFKDLAKTNDAKPFVMIIQQNPHLEDKRKNKRLKMEKPMVKFLSIHL